MIYSKKIIPDEYVSSIYDIDYNKLYALGIRLILVDLDNTLISYKHKDVTPKLVEFKKNIESMGFELIIVSNSRKKRVSYFANNYNTKYVSFAKKPLKLGLKKAFKIADNKYSKAQAVLIGDQLMTDVVVAKRHGIYSILVKAIDNKTEMWTTKVNRKIENIMIKSAKKKYLDLYNKALVKYVSDKNET